jgi:hypothetical protein
MSNTGDFPWLVLVPMSIFLVILIASFYMMWAKPEQWVEWFISKPYAFMGLQVKIVDLERFRKVTRIYSSIPIFLAIIGLIAAVIASKTGTH